MDYKPKILIYIMLNSPVKWRQCLRLYRIHSLYFLLLRLEETYEVIKLGLKLKIAQAGT